MAQYDIAADVAELAAAGITRDDIEAAIPGVVTYQAGGAYVYNRREQAAFNRFATAALEEAKRAEEIAAAQRADEATTVRSAAAPSTGATKGEFVRVPVFVVSRVTGETTIDAHVAASQRLVQDGYTWARVAADASPHEFVTVTALSADEMAEAEASQAAVVDQERAEREAKAAQRAEVKTLLAGLTREQATAVAAAVGTRPGRALENAVTGGTVTLDQIAAAVAEVTA